MTELAVLELSYPPSVNHYYTKWCKYLAKAAKYVVKVAVGHKGSDYRAEVLRYKLERLDFRQPLKCRIAMEIELWRPDRRKEGYNIDNALKCLLDAITYAQIWVDDDQVDCLLIHKRGVEAPGKVIVTLREI